MRLLIFSGCLLLICCSISSCGKAETPEEFLSRLSAIVAAGDEAALWDSFIDKGELKQLMVALPGMISGDPTTERIEELWSAMSEDKGRMLRRFTGRFDMPWWTMEPDSTHLDVAPPEVVQSKNVKPAQLYLLYRQAEEEEAFALSIVRFGNGRWKLFNYPDR